MENSEHRFLAEAPVGKLMRRYAMPCVISLLVGALYNIVDQIFIANASYLGSFGNAANTVVFPMTVIALAIAVMIGDGCCAFVSLSLGKGRPEDASRSTGNAVVLSVTAGFVLMAIYLLLRDPLLTVFGGRVNDETVVLLSHKKADSYIHIDVEFGEGEGKIPVDSIAKRAEAYKPKEKVTYKMIKEYIEAKYGFKVHTAYIAEVKRNLGLPMYDAPNAVEELKQPRKHPTPEKVEAIKDALRYFAVI